MPGISNLAFNLDQISPKWDKARKNVLKLILKVPDLSHLCESDWICVPDLRDSAPPDPNADWPGNIMTVEHEEFALCVVYMLEI